MQEEFNCAGVVTFAPARISIGLSDCCEEATAAEARQIAAALLNAADKFDGVGATT